MTSPADEHETRAAAHRADRPVGCAVLTVSDTRTAGDDASGDLIARLLVEAGHRVLERAIVPDEPARIEAALRAWIDEPAVELIVSTGGTGVSARDVTVEVVRPLLTAELEGFGELFRMLSHRQVGAAAMLSRAVGGLARRDAGGATVLFALPGSTKAVDLAMRELIVPQVAHLVWLASG